MEPSRPDSDTSSAMSGLFERNTDDMAALVLMVAVRTYHGFLVLYLPTWSKLSGLERPSRSSSGEFTVAATVGPDFSGCAECPASGPL